MKNKIGLKLIVVFLFSFLVLISIVSAQTQTYTKDSAGLGRNPTITCDAGDKRISCKDIGGGKNHGCDPVGENGCNAWEGPANYGVERCEITCEKKLKGCINKEGKQSNAGSLTRETFDTYYPETGDAQKDPDQSKEACGCLSVSKWNDNGKCCGDDADDCGKISSDALCIVNEDSAAWETAKTKQGEITYVGCSNLEYLSDGTNWVACNGVFQTNPVKINDRHYLCAGVGKDSIFECCGDGACKSKNGKVTGQLVNISDKIYYCASDRIFSTDLDSKDEKTCKAAGFKWTGKKCCSEADDNLTNNKEFYNDADGNGACWNSTYVKSVDFVNTTNESVISYKGAFHGCAINQRNYDLNNDNLLNLKDKHTSNPLITNHDYCFNDSEKKFYCSYTERWVQITDDIERNHLSEAPIQNPSQKAECCPQNECWNASQCISNQKFDPTSLPLGNTTARCIDGNWINSTKKTSFDGGASGYCPSEAQCLFNALFKNESSCINSGQYVADNYCENGKWGSRTKLLALKLLKLKSGDYTLFCDTRENALNNLQYFIPESNEIVVNILTNIQTNNFCVLKAGSTVIGATSINKNLEDLPQNSLNIFGVVDCKPAVVDDGQYHACDSTNKVWYNKKLKSFIYSSSLISVPSEEEQVSFIGNIIKTIIDAIKRLITSQPFNVAYLENIKKFDKLYMAQQGSRAIRGTIEGTNPKNTVVEYEGFDTDICQFVGQFNRTKSDAFSGIACKKEANKYYVLGQGSKTTNFNPEDIWPDLTSKLRLK